MKEVSLVYCAGVGKCEIAFVGCNVVIVHVRQHRIRLGQRTQKPSIISAGSQSYLKKTDSFSSLGSVCWLEHVQPRIPHRCRLLLVVFGAGV